MAPSLLLSTHSVVFLALVVSVSLLPRFDFAENGNYTLCKRNFDCGLLPNLSYPFWGSQNRSKVCGGGHEFHLICEAHRYPIRRNQGQDIRIFYVDQSAKVMSWIHEDVWNLTLCPGNFVKKSVLNLSRSDGNSGLPESEFVGHPLFLYSGCALEDPKLRKFPCPIVDEEGSDAFYTTAVYLDRPCEFRGRASIPKEKFSVSYTYSEDSRCPLCEDSHGICGSNETTNGSVCLCTDGPSELRCEVPGNGLSWKNKIIVAVVTASFTTIVIALVFLFIRRRRKNQRKLAPSSFASQNLISDQSSRGDLEKIGSKYYGLHVFTYAELEEATHNFDSERELGDGGFGTVYYGILRDGRAVAVKRLYENNYKRVEQFMNEIDILTRLRHPNLVSLYGCTSRHSRELLLVYEYIQNGTVADHLHGEKAKPGALSLHTRINIAVETASALAYLHASDIIHRDVKTSNILLDRNFKVKVADFGLSRLFPTDVTHVSTCPQGTPGYVDPEYHECYQLTDKSDVYSFGVVLMELISSMPAVDITRHRHDINLSSMAMNKIQNDALHELVDPNLGYKTDPAARRMINAVAELGFMCLQMEKDLRPCMDEALETLQGIQTNDYSIEN